MALSKSALKRAIDSVPECHDVGVWVVRVCRAVEAEVRKQDDALILQLVQALDGSIAITMGKRDLRNAAIAAARARGWEASHERHHGIKGGQHAE